jgi:ABC-type multidrug transport system ATPase subunit
MNEICDRVGVLNDKRLMFLGTPEDLKKEGGNDNLERAFLKVIGE